MLLCFVFGGTLVHTQGVSSVILQTVLYRRHALAGISHEICHVQGHEARDNVLDQDSVIARTYGVVISLCLSLQSV